MATQAQEQNSIQDRVTAICNDLYAKGTKPTVRLVLSMLPDVSSTSTVHKYFGNWKKELEAGQQSLYDKLGFSSEFTQTFMKEITRFSVQAEERYKEQAQDANEQREMAIEELERSEDRLHKQNALLDQSAKEIKELQTELLKSQESLKSQLAQEQESNKVIVAELRQQLAQQADENKALSANNEQLRTDIAKADLKLEGNLSYVEEVKQQNSGLLEENKVLSKEINALSKAVATLEATGSGNDKLIAKLEKLDGENATEKQSLINNVAEQRKELELSRTANIELKNELSASVRKIEELQSNHSEQLNNYSRTLAGFESTIAGNEKLIHELESKISSMQINHSSQLGALESTIEGLKSED